MEQMSSGQQHDSHYVHLELKKYAIFFLNAI